MITTNLEIAKEALENNDIIAIPTETVYGLAGNAYSESAVKKIFELKKRPLYNPLIVHIKNTQSIHEIASEIPEIALKLAQEFWPGSLTLLLKKQDHISDFITAGKNTVAVRVPNHPITLALLEQIDFPLAAPSANPFGCISPTNSNHVATYFKEELKIILEGGECQNGLESTIIGFDNNQAVLYRHGSIPVEEIEKITGKLIVKSINTKNPEAPGMLTRHYAPKTTTYLTNNVSELIKSFQNKKIGVLVFKEKINNEIAIHQEILSPTGNFNEAAKNLYAAMHRLDKHNLDVIIAEKLPELNLGKTINDRLQRAIKK